MTGFVVLIGTAPGQEAAGPFTSAAAAERLADDIRAAGTRAEIVGLVTAKDARAFFCAKATA